MLRRHRAVLAPLALAAALAVPLRFAADAVYRRMGAERFEVRYIPSGRALRFLSPAAQLTVANYYWLLTVQYIGEQALRRGGFDRLYALVDLVTDLDPQHGYAYQTAGLALSGAERLEESEAILRKGMERGPSWWSYPFYIAFNHYYYLGDYATAAEWARRAARTPGASPNVSALALALEVKSGSPDDAVRFIEEMRATVQDERLREALDEQYRSAVHQRNFKRLDEAVERFRAARGRPPATLREVVAAGLVDAIPPEPYGGAYVLRDGAVHSTARDHRIEPATPGIFELRRRMKGNAP
jgi:tetratricopeptide (TPR) repeat protein